MISAEIILDKRYKTKKGYPVKIRVYDSLASKKGGKDREYIGLSTYQDFESLKLTQDLKRRELDLVNEIKFCNDHFLSLQESVQIIKNGIPENDIEVEIKVLEKRLELLKAKIKSKNETGILEFIDTIVKEREIRGRPISAHQATKRAIARHIYPNLDFPINGITREWINNFDLSNINKGLKDSSIFTYINMIRSVYKEAQLRESLNIKKDNPFVKIRSFKIDKVKTELTIEDLIKIKNIELSQIVTRAREGSEYVKRIADIFVFQFCIGGHDLVDIANLKWENVAGGRIKFKRFKNRFKKSAGEEVDNHLNEFCINIIEKYGDKESESIFSFLGEPESEMYLQNIRRLNTCIYKIIAKTAGINYRFTSKSTRYLFRTEAGNLLIDSLMLMKLQGHSPQGVTFGYQGAINHDVLDREHKKILDLVFK